MATRSFQSRLYPLELAISFKEYKQRIVIFLPKFEKNDLIKGTEPFSPFLPRLIPSFPAIYPPHVWHMAATDLHASIMLDAIVLEGGREREWCLQYLPRGIRPRCSFCIKREGGDERCQCPLSGWHTSSLNNRQRETGRGGKWNSGAIFCCGFS